jgi:hypothetical protein
MHGLRRRDFVAFPQKAWPHVIASELVDWNWHLDAIAFELDRVRRGLAGGCSSTFLRATASRRRFR